MRSYTNFMRFILILVIYTVILDIFTSFFGANFPKSFGANINVFSYLLGFKRYLDELNTEHTRSKYSGRGCIKQQLTNNVTGCLGGL